MGIVQDSRRHLYHARINSRLSLEQLGLRTALSPSVLRHIDEGRFELLPSGVYARSYVRAFAAAVGLDPEGTLAEVEHLLPGAPDPIPVLHDIKNAGGVADMTRRIRTELSTLLKLDALETTWPTAVSDRAAAWHAALSSRLPARLNHGDQWPAAAIDACLLVAVDAFLVFLISVSSGVGVETLLREAGPALAAFCALPILLYFLLFGGIAGSTLGRYAIRRIAPTPPGHPLTLPDILRRAVFR